MRVHLGPLSRGRSTDLRVRECVCPGVVRMGALSASGFQGESGKKGHTMHVSLTASEVRQVVLRVFRLHGEDISSEDHVDERLRVQNGRLAARSYRAGDLFAMWLVDVGLLQFYDADGNMLQTINLIWIASSERVAA